MWESRPLPKIVRDPLAAHSARGSFLYGAPPHGASACPIPQRQDFPSAILPVGSLVVPGTGRGALAVGERCKESTAGRGERMPVWGDAHRFAGEKRGFPASVLMAGERKQEGWGVGWHRHGATALPAPILDTPQVMAVVASGGGWRGGGQADVAAPPGLIRRFLRHSARLRQPVGTPSPFATVAADQHGTGETV